MSDILEDQKIHYIVKDYQRMFNGYHALKDEIKELNKTIYEKDKEIILLRSRVNELKKKDVETLPLQTKAVKGKLNEIETRTDSLTKQMEKLIAQAQKNITNVEEIRDLLKNNP